MTSPDTTTNQRYVIHLPVVVPNLAAARHLAHALARSVAFLPQIDTGETTVSEECDQSVRHRVFCDRLLDGGRRCPLRHEHDDPCTPPEGYRS